MCQYTAWSYRLDVAYDNAILPYEIHTTTESTLMLSWLPFALIAAIMITLINFGDKFLIEDRIPDARAVLIYFSLVNIVLGLILLLITGGGTLAIVDIVLGRIIST